MKTIKKDIINELEQVIDKLVTCLEFYENLEDNKSLFHVLDTTDETVIHYYETNDDGEADPLGTFASLTLQEISKPYSEYLGTDKYYVHSKEDKDKIILMENNIEWLMNGIKFYINGYVDRFVCKIKKDYDTNKNYYYEKVSETEVKPFGSFATEILKGINYNF